MSHVFNKPSLWQRARPLLIGFDVPLLLAIVWLMGLGLISMYSAGFDHGTRFVDQQRPGALPQAGLVEHMTHREAPEVAALAAAAAASGEPGSGTSAAILGLPTGAVVMPFCVSAMSSSFGYWPISM